MHYLKVASLFTLGVFLLCLTIYCVYELTKLCYLWRSIKRIGW